MAEEDIKKIFVVGLPGSGKSTQAKKLAEKFDLCCIIAGDLFREKAQESSEIGRHIKRFLDKGELVDDETAISVLKKTIEESDCQNGYVIDGYPRTINQIDSYNPGFEKVFYLKIDPEEAKQRLISRGRDDDDLSIIEHRFEVQLNNMQEVIDYFEKDQGVITINATLSVEEIHELILNHL